MLVFDTTKKYPYQFGNRSWPANRVRRPELVARPASQSCYPAAT